MASPNTHANVASVEHEGSRFPPFDATTFGSQLLWLAISFGILYLLVGRVIVPRLQSILGDRHARVAADLKAASDAKAQAEAAGEAYETALTNARANAQAIAQQTRDKLASEADAKRKALESELQDKLSAAEATIKTRTAEAMGSVRSIATDTATAIVERLVGHVPDRTKVEAALDKTVA